MTVQRKKIGKVSVDSGMLMVADPCYVQGGFSYPKVMEALEDKAEAMMTCPSAEHFREIRKEDNREVGIAVFSGWGGDGFFDVWVETEVSPVNPGVQLTSRIIVDLDGSYTRQHETAPATPGGN